MNHNLLIIGFVWPEPHTTAAGIRMLQLIEVFQEHDFTITFVSTAAKSDNSFPLHSLNINTFQIHLNDNSFDALLKELKPDTVLFDRFLTEEQFGWRVAENCPNALRILDTEDLHFLRYGRQLALKNKETFAYKHMINDLFKRELASIYRSDLSLIISKLSLHIFSRH